MPDTYQLSDRGFLKVSGPDAIKFLQGYATCDLTALAQEKPQLGAICNLQGRMLTSFLIIRSGDDLILRMHRPLVTKTIEFLKKYIVFSKAELSDISEELACYGAQGVSDTLSKPGGYTLDLGNRFEYWLPAGIELDTESNTAAWLESEVEAGIAWVTDATSEEFLPQMFNYHELGGIDFEKGCYLGQEIVARAQYRGELKRRLHRIAIDSKRTVGESLDSGTIVAVAGNNALAVIKHSDEKAVTVTFSDGESAKAIPAWRIV